MDTIQKIGYPLLFAISLYELFRRNEETNEGCWLPINTLITTSFGIESILAFKLRILKWTPETKEYQKLNAISQVLLLSTSVCYLMNLIKTPTCMSNPFKFSMTCFYIPVCILSIAYTLSLLSSVFLKKIEVIHTGFVHQNLRTEIVNSLKMSFTNPDHLSTFYTTNQESLQKLPVTDEEILYFKDNFRNILNKGGSLFEHNSSVKKQEGTPKKECGICFDALVEEESYVSFPKCMHQYHHECFENWVKKNPSCSVCKQDFRIGFAESIKEKANQSINMNSGFTKKKQKAELSALSPPTVGDMNSPRRGKGSTNFTHIALDKPPKCLI